MRRIKGFTIIEVIVAISVLAVLAGISIVGFGSIQKDTGTTVCKSNISNMENRYQVEKHMDPVLTKIEFLENITDYFDRTICPSGGTYFVKENAFCCTEHSGIIVAVESFTSLALKTENLGNNSFEYTDEDGVIHYYFKTSYKKRNGRSGYMEYDVAFEEAGTYMIAMDAKNFTDHLRKNYSLPDDYSAFEFEVHVGEDKLGEQLLVQASDKAANTGALTFDIAMAGEKPVSIYWINDVKRDKTELTDVNLEIVQVAVYHVINDTEELSDVNFEVVKKEADLLG